MKTKRAALMATLLLATLIQPAFAKNDRERTLDAIVKAMSPLFVSYEVVGPVSVRINMNAKLWNRALTRDEQQQALDSLAAREIVQSLRNTLHLYVHQTEVGTIGPGWNGQWKFRRAE